MESNISSSHVESLPVALVDRWRWYVFMIGG
jgi:hypothetical protein